ncbi:MAG: uroporphyrinogen decarboxylase [Bacillota bacterium]|nr:uroporphyrinogen decarboxylase [Bacillota bacterium]
MDGVKNPRLLLAARGETVDRPPVWFMRQAGRYQARYRALRQKYTLLDIVRQPELAAMVTLWPVEELGVDGAILFSDIVVPLAPMGISVDIREGVGPVVDPPVRTAAYLEKLRPLEPEEDLPYVLQTVSLLAKELEVPLIGFAGGPFTLASYLVEGGPSRSFLRLKTLMYREEALYRRLMDLLTESIARHLLAQIAHGAHLVQLFDSWVGTLSPEDYRLYVAPYSRAIAGAVAAAGAPLIHFGVGTSSLLEEMAAAGGDVLGIDWREPLGRARRRLGETVLQGNLDPALLLAEKPLIQARVRALLEETGGQRHIFNLGHGVLPQTPPQALSWVVEEVHRWTV